MEIKGKSVILTGASSGIGLSLARLLALEKCNLALCSRRLELLDKISLSLKDKGSRIITRKCDVRNRSEIAEAIKSIKEEFGSIDIAILNSGISVREGIENFSSDSAEEIFKVNVLGLIYCTEAVIPDFLEKKSGLIVGVSSLADARGFPKSGFYCASKAAASKFMESLRIESKKNGIKVITVKPGFVKTPMTDKNKFKMPFLMDPDKAAMIILKGIKKEKRIIQFPLPTVMGAKLLKIMPDFLFDRLAEKR